jgi:hypothetical protein
MNICQHDNETFYIEGHFGIGSIIYVDENLTIPLTGSTLFSQHSSGKVYSIDASTGEILAGWMVIVMVVSQARIR